MNRATSTSRTYDRKGDKVFERITHQGQVAIVLAQEEARALGHPRIGTAHLLLGLAQRQLTGGAVISPEHHAFVACKAIGVDYARIRTSLIQVTGSRGPGPAGHIPFTQTGKYALESALRAALTLENDVYINTGHLLLGLTYDKAADPRAPEQSFFRRKAHLHNPAFYDVGQRALIDVAGSLARVRDAVRSVDVSGLGVLDTTPAGTPV